MIKTFSKIAFLGVLLLSAGVVFGQQTELEKGVAFYDRGEYQQAVESLQRAVAANEKDKAAWLYLGMSHSKAKRKSEAVNAFKAADKIPDKADNPDPAITKLAIVSKLRVTYTEAARANQIQGVVKLAVEFGADGKIKSIVPFRLQPFGLTEAVVEAVQEIKFEPAKKNGQPFSTIRIIEYSFTIR